jgi:hypothetical protein
MAILSYKSEEPTNREAMSISFDMPDDMNIYEFKIMCVRLASSIGYQSKSIKSAFGETENRPELNKEFEQLINSMNIRTGSLI